MHEAVQQFVEQVGIHGERNGIPRIAARLTAWFVMNPQSQSLDDIAAILQVSKASVSTNARLLEAMGVLERAMRPGDRRDYYHLGEHPWEKMFRIQRQRLEEMKKLLEANIETLPTELEVPRKNMQAWHTFLTFMLQEIDQHIQRWSEQCPVCAANGESQEAVA